MGWLAADSTLQRKVVVAKQAQDICATVFGQYCVFEAMTHDILFNHINILRLAHVIKTEMQTIQAGASSDPIAIF